MSYPILFGNMAGQGSELGTQLNPAPNASLLRSEGYTSGTYWINVQGTPRQIYCDLTTNSEAWYLIAQQSGSSGILLNSNNNGISVPLINNSSKLAFSWNQSGGITNGDILSYNNAISFNTPSASMTLDGSTLNPGVGTFVTASTNSETFATSITNLKGSHGLEALGTYYTRKTSFTVNYGNSYGIVGHPSQVQGDWGPDGQVFRTIYFSRNGANNSSYVTASGTGSGYVPSAIALWAKSA